MYDPSVGRWPTEDPSRFAAGDPNLYRYVGNNPTNATDPSGLESIVIGTTKLDNSPKTIGLRFLLTVPAEELAKLKLTTEKLKTEQLDKETIDKLKGLEHPIRKEIYEKMLSAGKEQFKFASVENGGVPLLLPSVVFPGFLSRRSSEFPGKTASGNIPGTPPGKRTS